MTIVECRCKNGQGYYGGMTLPLPATKSYLKMMNHLRWKICSERLLELHNRVFMRIFLDAPAPPRHLQDLLFNKYKYKLNSNTNTNTNLSWCTCPSSSSTTLDLSSTAYELVKQTETVYMSLSDKWLNLKQLGQIRVQFSPERKQSFLGKSYKKIGLILCAFENFFLLRFSVGGIFISASYQYLYFALLRESFLINY